MLPIKILMHHLKKNLSIHKKEARLIRPYEHFIAQSMVFLRPTFPNDYAPLCELYTNEKEIKYLGLGKAHTEASLKEMIGQSAKNNLCAKKTVFAWTFFTPQGCAGRVKVALSQDPEYLGYKEISYTIVPSQKHRGLTTCATKAAINYCGGHFFATVHPENIASKRILEKLGFSKTLEGVQKYGSVRDYYVLEDNDSNKEEHTSPLGF